MIVKINGNVLDSVKLTPIEFKTKLTQPKSEIIFYSAGLLPLITAYMGISQYLTVGVIMFAGTAWMFGHRTKAIELLIGAAAGFLLILNAWDMVHFLEGLKAK